MAPPRRRSSPVRSRLRACTIVVAASLGVVASGASAAPTASKTGSVLIVGDSVANSLRWADGAIDPIVAKYKVNLQTWGCQKLVTPGCLPGGKPKSALDFLRAQRSKPADVVIVMAGYNETSRPAFRPNIRTINKEAASQGTHVIWVTYRQSGNVTTKSAYFNQVLREEDARLPNLTLADWAKFTKKHPGWFGPDRVHMYSVGGLGLGRFLRKALDDYFASLTSSVTTTVPATTVQP